MGVALLRSAPADASGGYMNIRFDQAGEVRAIERLHLVNIGVCAGVWGDLKDLLKLLYNPDWQITVVNLTEHTGLHTFLRRPVPLDTGLPLTIAGDGSDATAGTDAFVQTILTSPSTNGGTFKVRYVGVGGTAIGVPAPIAANAAGTPLEKLVDFFGSSPDVVAHDGGSPNALFYKSEAFVTKVRRRNFRRE